MNYLILKLFAAVFAFGIAYVSHSIRSNPLRTLPGPRTKWFKTHLNSLLNPSVSPRVHEYYVHKYGRTMTIQGMGPWDLRLLTLDPVSIAHVLKNSAAYEKPWQSRQLITSLIGCGMLSAEGIMHKRQRRVATPAFSIQNMRTLIPVVFQKGSQLRDTWMEMAKNHSALRVDVCSWLSRATFDVMGLAGFDYDFNAIQNESNELFLAYKEMFEIGLSRSRPIRTLCRIYVPFISSLLGDPTFRTIKKCQGIIYNVAGKIIQEKKLKIAKSQQEGIPYFGGDLLSLLLKANIATDLPIDQRISDSDILHNVNTFMFAGSDTSSLTLTWTLLLLAQNPSIQDRLRVELLSVSPTRSGNFSHLTEEELQSLYAAISNLPLLHNVVRESARLVPPVHSSLRVATRDDEIPLSHPFPGGRSSSTVKICKGSFVHVPIEGFNLDKEFWGQNAWEFMPDRWDHLPESATELPGLFSNTLTFSAGPRSCIGMRFSIIEIKTFIYVLLTNFTFCTTEDKIVKSNVVLTRPYLYGRFTEGSQCPLLISPI